MAKRRTKLCIYPSRYAKDHWVTEAQYIIEFICEAKAKCENKDLPQYFWNLDEWKLFYKSQLRATHKLLKNDYSIKAILNVIKNSNSKIWSLRPKWVHTLISKEQDKLNKQEKIQSLFKEIETSEKSNSTSTINIQEKRTVNIKNKLDKLLDLDEKLNGEEED